MTAPLLRRLAVAVACLATVGATAVTALPSSAAETRAASAKGRHVCTPPKFPNSKVGRSRMLTTFYLSCATGRKLALGHFRCTVKKGSVCRRYLGYKCYSQRLNNPGKPFLGRKGFYEQLYECQKGKYDWAWVYRHVS